MKQKEFSNEAVAFGALELELIKESPQQWTKRVETKTSRNQFNMLMLALNRHATYKEIRYFLDECNYLDLEKSKIATKVKGYMRQWKKKLKHLEPKVFSSEANYTKTIHIGRNHWLIHYQYQTIKNEPSEHPFKRPTVIGVPGVAGMLMTPTSCILSALSELKRDLIIIRKCRKESYFHDNSTLLEDIHNHISSRLGASLSQSMAFGTSAGGLAAICLGTMFGLDLVVGISPGVAKENVSAIKNLSKNPHIHEKQAKTPKTKVVLCTASAHEQDIKEAIKIHKKLTMSTLNFHACKIYLFKNTSKHVIFNELADQGITISECLSLLLCDTPPENAAFNTLIIDLTSANNLEKLICSFKPD